MNNEEKELAQAFESGDIYRNMVAWYNDMYHAPIQERTLLIIVTVSACFTTLIALFALFLLLPIEEQTPVIVPVENALDRIVSAQPLMPNADSDANEYVLQWLVKNYVESQESYDITKQESFSKRVHAISAPEVYREYVTLYRGEGSPTLRYERHTTRSIQIRSIELSDDHAEITFVATEESSREDRKTQWKADISFRYEEIKVDQVSGEVMPMKFEVTGYKSKQIG